ncbi:hypothetical protein [Brenneria tiliae]|uniref:Uncharacterized protein n=1 Tax=Brenneria tiliae TaxID=2914984 RepID=A0ABT0MZ22_9GAMM|nr:hypothetical protein [Brenneria tiliae]MCL2894802.1 hypothetical protein [Brenneria tiliae]MCL2898486.1 hypothetical protein [Brenneria tiliae]MCL2902972.1 hypothetical protein [Brenneria tiliae]
MSVVWDIDMIDGPIDQVRKMRISGLAPGIARLSASLAHPDGSLWRSEATFSIAGDGPHPVAIVLSGSGGGAPEQRAALLAAQEARA